MQNKKMHASLPFLPALLAPADFKKVLKAKRLTISDFAYLAGESVSTTSRAIADPHRKRGWDLMLSGIPAMSALDVKALQVARRSQEKGLKRQGAHKIIVVPAPQPGDIVACTAYIGEIADEGEKGVISDFRKTGPEGSIEYRINFSNGSDWFPAYFLESVLILTGEEITP